MSEFILGKVSGTILGIFLITGNVYIGLQSPRLDLWSLPDASTLWYSRASCLVAALEVPPSGTLPLAGPDVLIVMCIGGGVNARSDSFSDFHSLKKIEYKSSFIGNDYQTVGYLGKEVYNTTAYSLIYDFSMLLRVESFI